MQAEQGLSFGSFRLSSPRGPLVYRSQPVTLPPKAIAVLWYLAARAGQVVSKDELLTAIWGDAVVSEGVLPACLRTLRKALRDDAVRPRYIATVHRIGYRFLPAVTTQPVPSSPPLSTSTLHQATRYSS